MLDHELLLSTKTLVARERELATDVLRHLAEIERRKLYADLKFPSLFEYAVRELGYSEAAASRRIQAMRLVKEIPEVEAKIQSGALSLSNISQAQVFFRELKRTEPTRVVSREEKTAVLDKLEQKSAREAKQVLVAMNPAAALPREWVRQIDLEHTELRFVVTTEIQAKLQEVRSLLGPRGGSLSLAELVAEMASAATQHLAERKFGKKRIQAEVSQLAISETTEAQTAHSGSECGVKITPRTSDVGSAQAGFSRALSSTSLKSSSHVGSEQAAKPEPTPRPTHTRYIPQAVKHAVWRAAGGKCSCCGSRSNLQFDHIHPVALGGTSAPGNLQLLCGSCNLRRGVKTFGTRSMQRV